MTILLIVMLGLAVPACGPQKAANHLEAVKQRGSIKVGISADYPPYESKDAQGNKVGFDIDLMTEITKRMGVKLEWVDISYNNLVAALQQGKIDAAISGLNYDQTRDEQIDYTEAYYTPEDALVVREDFNGKLNKPEDLGLFIVGTQTTSTQENWLEKNLVAKGLMPEQGVYRFERVDKGIADLQSAQIHVFFTDYIPALALMKQYQGLKILYHGVLSGIPLNIAIPQGDQEMAKTINDLLNQLKKEGFIDKLVDKYIGEK